MHSRALQMEAPYPSGYGLGVMIGLNERQVTALVDRVDQGAGTVFVSNINAESIAHGVRWHEMTVLAQELGCELLLETPPGHIQWDHCDPTGE